VLDVESFFEFTDQSNNISTSSSINNSQKRSANANKSALWRALWNHHPEALGQFIAALVDFKRDAVLAPFLKANTTSGSSSIDANARDAGSEAAGASASGSFWSRGATQSAAQAAAAAEAAAEAR